MKYTTYEHTTSQHCCDKTMDEKLGFYRECCFPNCTKSWWIKLLPQVSGGRSPQSPPGSVSGRLPWKGGRRTLTRSLFTRSQLTQEMAWTGRSCNKSLCIYFRYERASPVDLFQEVDLHVVVVDSRCEEVVDGIPPRQDDTAWIELRRVTVLR